MNRFQPHDGALTMKVTPPMLLFIKVKTYL